MREKHFTEAYAFLPESVNPIAMVVNFLIDRAKGPWTRVLFITWPNITWEEEVQRAFSLSSPLISRRRPSIFSANLHLGSLRKNRKNGIHCIACSPDKLSFGANTFDLVCCPMILPRLPRESRAMVIAEIGRVLKPGGEAIILAPAPLHLDLETSRLLRYSDFTSPFLESAKREFFISANELVSYIGGLPLQVERCFEVQEMIFPSSKQRIALAFNDTIVPSFPHKRPAYYQHLRRLRRPTFVHWAVMVCSKEV